MVFYGGKKRRGGFSRASSYKRSYRGKSRPLFKRKGFKNRVSAYGKRSRRLFKKSNNPKSYEYRTPGVPRREKLRRSLKGQPLNPLGVGNALDLQIKVLNLVTTATARSQVVGADAVFQSMAQADILRILTACGYTTTNQTATQSFHCLKRHCRFDFTNTSNATCFVKIYKCWPRYDQISANGPLALWNTGYNQLFGAALGTGGSAEPNASPFESPILCKNYKIKSGASYCLIPGQTAVWNHCNMKRVSISFDRDPTNFFAAGAGKYYYKGITCAYLFCVQPEVSHLVGTGTGTVVTQVSVQFHERYEYINPPPHANTADYSSINGSVALVTQVMPEQAPSATGQAATAI